MANLDFILLINAINNHEESIEHNRYKRRIRDAADPFSLPNEIFRGLYRFNKASARFLIEEISNYLPEPDRNETSVSKEHIVMCALHFFSQGSYQKSVGQDINFPVSQSTVSRCVSQVTNVLNEHFHHYIKFPATEAEKNEEKRKFLEMPHAFPGIIGSIDGTHISIQAPPTEDVQQPGILFYNRKGFYSLNVQIICGADLQITGINARFPGSVHDSAIWRTSQIRNHLIENFENGDRYSYLIGDSGYPLEPWLINNVRGNNLNEHEERFNSALRSTRNVSERLNGVLKSRFRCCFGHRTLHYKPEKAAKIVNACAILHNILLEMGDVPNEEEIRRDDNENFAFHNVPQNLDNRNYLNEGRIVRNRIINNYF